MPVVITGAGGMVARSLVPLLVRRGPQVRAVVRRREDAEALRAAGAKVAVIRLSDLEALTLVMDAAHTVCHLAGGLDLPDERAYEEANLHTVRWALEAARTAKVARFLFLSYPGASAGAANAFLRAKGMAEDEIRSSGLEHAIVRSAHVYGGGSPWLRQITSAARGRVAVVVGPGTQRLAPVFVDDVAAVLAAADDRAAGVSGTFGLQGPEVLTADDLVDRLAGRPRRKLHLGPRSADRAARLLRRRLSPTFLEVLAADSLADSPDAAEEFSVQKTSLDVGLDRATSTVRP